MLKTDFNRKVIAGDYVDFQGSSYDECAVVIREINESISQRRTRDGF